MSVRSLMVSTLALALALGLSNPKVGFAQTPSAQSDENHDAHHPDANAEKAPAAKPSPEPKAPAQGSMGMQGGTSGMMGGDAQQMSSMMGMMRSMMTMMGAQSGMMMSNVEGRITSLKTDLKINDAQMPQWNRFADALRAAGSSMNTMYQQMMQQGRGSLLVRFEKQEQMLNAHLTTLKNLKDTMAPLYASFSDEQKKIADNLMIGPMGMM